MCRNRAGTRFLQGEVRMNTMIRRKLEMAARVREFSRVHLVSDPAQAGAVKQFEDDYTRAVAIVARQQQAIKAARGARARRREVRQVLHFQLLRYLSAVGDAAANEHPELSTKFRLPRKYGNNLVFLAEVQDMLTAAREQRDLLVSKGMSATLPDDLERMVAEFEQVTMAALAGRRDHMGARAELDKAAAALQQDVHVLDGIYSNQFGKDPEVMAEWEAVRFILGLPQPQTPPPPAVGGEAPPTTGA